MEGFAIIGGFILLLYLIEKVASYFDEKKATKELPILLKEIEELKVEQEKYRRNEDLIQDSVIKYRENYEENRGKQAYFAQKRYRKRY